jgi:DNA modification methylase
MPKQLLGIPWRVAFALQADGWWLRADIIWHKSNAMPESVTDRPTKSHEYIFLLTKSERYYYDANAIAEPAMSGANGSSFTAGKTAARADQISPVGKGPRADGPTRNKRSVWTVNTEPTPFAHFATFPQKLIGPMILAGCPVGGIVLDPFLGSGTTALVARAHGRDYMGCDLSPEYVGIAHDRLRLPFDPRHVRAEETYDDLPLFAPVAGE